MKPTARELLLAEIGELERLLAEAPAERVMERRSLDNRLKRVRAELAALSTPRAARLRAEIEELERELGALPPRRVIERFNLESHLDGLRRELEALEEAGEVSPPRRVVLTFRGAPVEGSRSIAAGFAAGATALFSEAVGLVQASLLNPALDAGDGPFSVAGLEPRIVDKALGSFGFEFELAGPLAAESEPDPLRSVLELLEAAGRDDARAQAAALEELHPRAARKLGELLEYVAAREATLGLVSGSRGASLPHAAACRGLGVRLAKRSAAGEAVTLRGVWVGVLPHARTFELRLDGLRGEVVCGELAMSAEAAQALRVHQGRRVEVSARVERGPGAAPRYTATAVVPISEGAGMGGGPEFDLVEEPFMDQLVRMGWRQVTGSVDDATATGRESFREVLMRSELREALLRLNPGPDGGPWLDEGRIGQAISALERLEHLKLMEANQAATRLLLDGIRVQGLPGWEGGHERTIHYIDWDHVEANRFIAVSQFKVLCPPGQASESIRPDVTLFVNGIPVVVVECKSPKVSSPLESAIDQLRRYQNVRRAAGEVSEDEGAERLFYTNQLLVATCYDRACAGTIGAMSPHFAAWKDTAPVSREDVQRELGVAHLSEQRLLVAGMLRPSHLLELMRHFTLFRVEGGRTRKIVGRYQQFRAVHATLQRLQTGATRAEDGEHDQRGGIIWHTQGSGKSLTMVFLIRALRSMPALWSFKVVLVTDRRDLERQLSTTMGLTGETVQVARTVADARRLLAAKGPGLVCVTIQKSNTLDLEGLDPEEALGDEGVLNDDTSILVLVDEAHRSHTNSLHAQLMQMLPNCARVGFTGTPIIMGAKKKTHDIFGAFIDRYTLSESEADGATVPILYEGRTVKGAVVDPAELDERFIDLFDEPSEELQEIAWRHYGGKGPIQEATKLIAAKAADMLWHYVLHILPNGLKAQVVAYSRTAAIKYQAAFIEARRRLLDEAAALDAAVLELDVEALDKKSWKLRAAVAAARQREALERLEFGVVISPNLNDPEDWRPWSDAAQVEARIERFKDAADPLAFLIVKSMLLTGFDAPIEGVMYLDRSIREAELLQAIARVNRTGHGKQAGLVVDYYGVAHHLKDALSAYSDEDIKGALRSLQDELPRLEERYRAVAQLFAARGVDPLTQEGQEEALHLLAEVQLRGQFTALLKAFLATLDLVLPRREALPWVHAAEALGVLYDRARRLYREGAPLLGRDVGRKVQALIDAHMISLGVKPGIPPVELSDARFQAQVERQPSPRAKASEMEHALRHHIRQHVEGDPVYYQSLSTRLEEILKRCGEDWDRLAEGLRGLVEEAQAGRPKAAPDLGLDERLHVPFFALIQRAHAVTPGGSSQEMPALAVFTRELVEQVIRPALRSVDFWSTAQRREELRREVVRLLDDADVVDLDHARSLADELLGVARANHERLVKPS